ncbi:hypothetical protein Ae168Ps1_1903 [Pseudonocardia sp. Ae168_Ps1]|nr:hypothetical protein Ae150APs1_1904 [Pseudonocardia sp. Ae150A_Ps1]OLL79497.1 hypothetical protein Ae168Ps1_1903 [Pseudonocardia sp. Ae168_Ps1]OLL86363.1 hypothetical protein Ae263Ps1_3418c [Pseudonocardia sp. Ae263_Ps1]OLL93593.1 hypothetical protein Ae356Ps1_3490 [Pseudonocardia sp. Ae356_Ps1]
MRRRPAPDPRRPHAISPADDRLRRAPYSRRPRDEGDPALSQAPPDPRNLSNSGDPTKEPKLLLATA